MDGSDWIWKIVGAVFVLLSVLMAVSALPASLETKICTNLNLTIDECISFRDELYNVSVVTVNVTENITTILNLTEVQVINTTHEVIKNETFFVSVDDEKYMTDEEYGLQRLEDKANLKLELKEWIRQELKDEEVIQVVERNFTMDLSEYVKHGDMIAYVNGQSDIEETDNTLLFIVVGLIASGLIYYYFFHNKKPPVQAAPVRTATSMPVEAL